MRYDEGMFCAAAMHNCPAALAEYNRKNGRFRPEPGSRLDLVLHTKLFSHTADDMAEPTPGIAARLGGARSIIIVPMLKEDDLIGAIIIYRQEVKPFTDKQIALVHNFAAQAVIAIENARLLSELRESLEQQTATSEVLRVISSSPGELEPVFQAMLENAVRICEAKFGVMFRFDADVPYPVATLNLSPAVDDYFRRRGRLKPTPGSDLDRLWNSKQVIHTLDMSELQNPTRIAKLAGVRTQIAVPMLKDDALIGAINIFRQEVRPFTDKQIELLTNFSAQAVIAIENARLLNDCANRSISRRRQRMCCARSAPHRASLNLSFGPCWTTRCGFAKPIWVSSTASRTAPFAPSCRAARRPNMPPSCRKDRSILAR